MTRPRTVPKKEPGRPFMCGLLSGRWCRPGSGPVARDSGEEFAGEPDGPIGETGREHADALEGERLRQCLVIGRRTARWPVRRRPSRRGRVTQVASDRRGRSARSGVDDMVEAVAPGAAVDGARAEGSVGERHDPDGLRWVVRMLERDAEVAAARDHVPCASPDVDVKDSGRSCGGRSR